MGFGLNGDAEEKRKRTRPTGERVEREEERKHGERGHNNNNS